MKGKFFNAFYEKRKQKGEEKALIKLILLYINFALRNQ